MLCTVVGLSFDVSSVAWSFWLWSVGGCLLVASWCVVFGVWCLLFVVCCVLFILRWLLCVVRCVCLRCVLMFVLCCASFVVWCVLRGVLLVDCRFLCVVG